MNEGARKGNEGIEGRMEVRREGGKAGERNEGREGGEGGKGGRPQGVYVDIVPTRDVSMISISRMLECYD